MTLAKIKRRLGDDRLGNKKDKLFYYQDLFNGRGKWVVQTCLPVIVKVFTVPCRYLDFSSGVLV